MASKVANMEVWCVELEEINTIEYFAQKLGVKKIYNIKYALNNPRKTVGGCHFCTPEYGLENADFVEKPLQKNGYTVRCVESGEVWNTIAAAAESTGIDYVKFRKYLEKVDGGDDVVLDGRHYEVIALGAAQLSRLEKKNRG